MPGTDIFDLTTPALGESPNGPTQLAELASDVETALMAILGQERTVARASGILNTGATTAGDRYIATDSPNWSAGNTAADLAARRIQAESIWTPTQGFLLPVAGLKSVLTLKCRAVCGETNPSLADGEVIAGLGHAREQAGAPANWLMYDVLSDVGVSNFEVNAPVVTGNGQIEVSSTTLNVDAAADLDYLTSPAETFLVLNLRLGGAYAQTAAAPVLYQLELTHKYADID